MLVLLNMDSDFIYLFQAKFLFNALLHLHVSSSLSFEHNILVNMFFDLPERYSKHSFKDNKDEDIRRKNTK